MKKILYPLLRKCTQNNNMNFNIQSLLESEEEDMEEIDRIFNVDGKKHLDFRDVHGYTLLHLSVIYDQKSVMQYLINNKCDVNAQDLLGRTPLMLALKGKNEKIMQALLEAEADMFCVADNKGKSALHKFFKRHPLTTTFRRTFLRELRKRCSSSEEMAQKMIDAGCHIYQAAITKDATIIEYMLQHGLQVDSINPSTKNTALHVAVIIDDVESVKVLFKYGINPRALNRQGLTSLYYVYNLYPDFYTDKQTEILQILLHHGMPPMLLMPEGYFQIKYTLINGNSKAIHAILQTITDFTAKDTHENNILHYLAANKSSGVTEELKIHINKLNINEVDNLGRSPLYLATWHSNVKMVQFLLEHGAETNCVDNIFLHTPLFHSYSLSQSDILNDQIIELLLQHNANPQYIVTEPSGEKSTIFDMVQTVGDRNRIKPAIAHLAVLEGLGTPITEIIRSKINSQVMFSEYFTECKQLLKKDIVKSVNVFQLLTANKKKMAQYVGNGNLVVKLKRLSYSQKIKSSFPYYWNTLSQRLSKGIEYRRLRKEAAGVICKLFEDRVHNNDLIIDSTIDYLDDQDLQQLSKLQDLII